MKHHRTVAAVSLVAAIVVAANRPTTDTEGIGQAWEILVACAADEQDASVLNVGNHGRLALHVETIVESLREDPDPVAVSLRKELEETLAEYSTTSLAYTWAWKRQKNAQRYLGDELLKAGYVGEDDTDTPCPQEWIDNRTPGGEPEESPQHY